MNAGEADAEGQWILCVFFWWSGPNLWESAVIQRNNPWKTCRFEELYNPCHVPGSSGPAKEGGGENRFQPYWETERAGSTSNIQRTTAAVSQDRHIIKPSLT